MLSKVFIAADTPRGTFLSGMATILDRSSEEEEGMYLIHLYKGEDLQWPFRVSSQKAIAIPLAYHDVTYDDPSEGRLAKVSQQVFLCFAPSVQRGCHNSAKPTDWHTLPS